MPTVTNRTFARGFADRTCYPYTARNANGSLSADGGRAWTYKAPLASWYQTSKGPVVWVNSRRYSVTSSKHRTYVGGELARAGHTVVDFDAPSTGSGTQWTHGGSERFPTLAEVERFINEHPVGQAITRK